jgi:hypothetical protein
MIKKVLTDTFSEPLNGATTARVEINASDGNLTIEPFINGESLLAYGTLQYFEKQGAPTRTLVLRDGQAALTLKGSGAGQPWFRFPWSACNGATDWEIHLNPTVSFDLTVHSNGGNIRLDLSGMTVTGIMADTGGGNIDVILPDNAADLKVTTMTGAGNVNVDIGNNIIGKNIIEVSSGAGNVIVHIPNGIAACIYATARLGKVDVNPILSKVVDNAYQSADYENVANKIDIKANSGAGNVIVNTG